MIKEILLLGNEELYEISEEIQRNELSGIQEVVDNLHDTLIDFRNTYGAGRAIAAPQIGVKKRLIYMFIDEPTVFINPRLEFIGDETMEVIDDCMSFPKLYVRVQRHKKMIIHYKDMNFEDQSMELEGDLSELLQHEYDHLDGILATMRAKDNKSLIIKK